MITNKIVPLDCARGPHHPTRVVFTNGCFDVFHAGHALYLEKARSLGDLLFVGLNSDRGVHTLKGEGRPINKAQDRAIVLAALSSVDLVFIFDDPDVRQILRVVQPSIWVKGGDYRLDTLNPHEVEAARDLGVEIQILPMLSGRSTTAVLARINAVDSLA